MRKQKVTLAAMAAGLVVIGVGMTAPSQAVRAAEAKISYSEDVAPIFRERCVMCHAPGGQGNQTSGLDLSTYEGAMKGTKFGPMIIPGDPASSNLMWLIDWRGAPATHMPLNKKKLSTCDRDTIRAWIKQGAPNN